MVFIKIQKCSHTPAYAGRHTNHVIRQVLNDGVRIHAAVLCIGILIDRLARWKQQ